MQIISSLSEISKQVDQIRSSGKTIGFVPTMGALHAGHLQLIRTAASQNSVVVCSIFVNPTQFNNAEDYRLYPRLLEEDARILEANKCSILFAPDATEMYPEPLVIQFNFGTLETVMEGKYRPGHFNGVATVVSKLFHLVNPHKAYFGQKDLQQYTIIRQMVNDLNFNLKLVCHPIVREPDGLAMSSRNRRLSAAERQVATNLYRALLLAQDLLPAYEINYIKKAVADFLQPYNNIKLEYLEVVNLKSLQPLTQRTGEEGVALCIAAFIGEVRLIDNIIIQ
jgi:pantoate--beta-alanine ligase